MAAIQLTSETFQKEVLEAKEPVLVDFWAKWCGPCKMIAPVVEEISNELTDAKFIKVDVDENEDLANKYDIMSIPTLVVFKNGKPVETLVGFMPKDSLKEAVTKHL